MAGSATDPMGMVRAADDLKGPLRRASTDQVSVNLTGASGMWSDFNTANRDAMMRSELISWPVTLAILVLAFGALVAAGLPLLLTILGLASSAGALFLASQVFEVSIWAMNFALMFALALGIDYALFIVVRFRGALFGSKRPVVDAVAETMDTAGKAVLFSGITVLISLSAVMLVPSPAFRSMALGIMISVAFILAATLTLLPAVLAKLGPKVDRFALPWAHSGEHRSARFAAWGERLWRRPVRYGLPALLALLVLAIPVVGLTTGMPSIKVVPSGDSSRQGYEQVSAAFGPGAPGTLQLVGPAASMGAAEAIASADPGIARALPPQAGGEGMALVQAVPRTDPSDSATGATIDRLRADLPSGVLVGGAAAENHDLAAVLTTYTPLVIGVVLLLGFVLLIVALQAPVVAAIGVLTSLLATGAAFGVARLIFQDGQPVEPARLRVPGLPRRVGAGLLLRDDLRDLDGLHGVPAVVREGALGPLARRPGGGGRGHGPLGAGDPRRRGGDGRGVLHVRPLGAPAAQGDGRDPRGRRAAGRAGGAAAAGAGGAPARRTVGLVAPRVAAPPASRGPVRALMATQLDDRRTR